jgi:hypothetical protein
MIRGGSSTGARRALAKTEPPHPEVGGMHDASAALPGRRGERLRLHRRVTNVAMFGLPLAGVSFAVAALLGAFDLGLATEA